MTLRAYTGSVNLKPINTLTNFTFFFCQSDDCYVLNTYSKFINLCKAYNKELTN